MMIHSAVRDEDTRMNKAERLLDGTINTLLGLLEPNNGQSADVVTAHCKLGEFALKVIQHEISHRRKSASPGGCSEV